VPLTLLLVLGLIGLALLLHGSSRSSGLHPGDPDQTTLAELASAGSDLGRIHQIEFFLFLPSRGAAEEVAAELGPEGFRIEISAGETAGEWLCRATRPMRPELTELRRLRHRFGELARVRSGAYDGWGTEVVEPGDPV
jgi:hypothetical protein